MSAALSLPLLTHLGSYELVRLLAQGGMADIYLARQAGLERDVAVKVLNHQRANDPEAAALFLDEARLLAMLDHPSVARVYEVNSEAGVHYLAMEYVHGGDLRELLAAAQRAGAAIPYDVAVSIIAAAATGLDHAHRRCGPDGRPLHLVHRDVSLSNIMVAHDGAVKVIDFGIACATVSMHVTNPGIVRGKASYMAPEQCMGEPVDLRTDVFALGVVLYELTTGRRCFLGNGDFDRMLAVVRGDYVPVTVHVPDFPPALARVIETALATDPAHRYPSAAALVDALERAAQVEGWVLGAPVIARTMQALFGAVGEPWRVHAAEDTASRAFDPGELVLPRQDPTVVITKPRRLARGTECEADTEVDDHDDAPTRGRRSMPRVWTLPMPPLAA